MREKIKVETFPDLLLRSCTHPLEWVTGLACPNAARKIAAAAAKEAELGSCCEKLDQLLFKTVSQLDENSRPLALEFKRFIKKRPFENPKGKALKAFETLSTRGDDLAGALQEFHGLLDAYLRAFSEARDLFTSETREARKNLVKLMGDPFIQEGILLSSQSLYDGVIRSLKNRSDDETKLTKSQRQLERSFVEHLGRAASKTTPRGLLTAVGGGKWAARSEIPKSKSGGARIQRRKSLLSLPLVTEIAKNISRTGDLWKFVVPRSNPTWHVRDGKIHFWTKQLETKRFIGDTLLALPSNELIETFLSELDARSLTAEQLIEKVYKASADHDITRDDIENFFRKLCDRGLIMGHLEIPYEKHDGLAFLDSWLSDALEKTSCAEKPLLAGKLDGIRKARQILLRLDESAAGTGPFEHYRALIDLLHAEWPEETSRWKADAAVEATFVASVPAVNDVKVGEEIWNSLQAALKTCAFLTFALTDEHKTRRAAARYLRRYGIAGESQEMQYVPLIKVFEADIEKKPVPPALAPENPNDTQSKNWREVTVTQNELMEKVQSAVPTIDLVACGVLDKLTALEFNARSGNHRVQFAIGSDENKKPFVVLDDTFENLGGGFGRYTELVPSLADSLKIYFKQLHERDPKTLWADCLVLSNTRTDTAIWYECFNDHVMEVFNSRSDKPGDLVIPMRQLFLKLHGENADLVWKKDDKETVVHPCCETFAAFGTDAHALQFLKNMHVTGVPSLTDWRIPFVERSRKIKIAPRLTIGSVVLSRATWFVDPKEVAALISEDAFQTFANLNKWRAERNLPRHVFVKFGREKADKPFWVDFTNTFHLTALESAVNNATDPSMRLIEMLPSPEQAWIKDESGSYATQLAAGTSWQLLK